MKKKYTSLIAVSLIVALLLTTAASASFIDGLQYFVTEGYQGREQLLGFFMIFLIFFSVLFGALQKTTFKDQKNASIVIAFCVALISAISIISQIEFSISGFRYIAEGLFFLLLVILIYSLLVKIGMEKHKFFAFILAILIAAFLIFIVHRLIEEGPSNMFEGLGSDLNFGGVGLGREKAKKSLTPEELEDLKLQWVEENLVKKSIEKELNKLKGDIQTTTDPEKYRSIRNELRSKRSESKSSTKRIKDIHNDLEDNNVPEEELAGLMPVEPTPKKGSNIIWIILVVALTLGTGTWLVANRIRNQRRSETTTTEEKLIEDIEKTLKAKDDVTKQIEAIGKRVVAIENKVSDVIKKFVELKTKGKNEMDPIFDTDPDSGSFKNIEDERKLIIPLIREEVQLEKGLVGLDKIEEELLKEIQGETFLLSRLIPLNNIQKDKIKAYLSSEEGKKLLGDIDKLRVLMEEIRKQLREFFNITKTEIKEETEMVKWLSEDKAHMQERRFKRWEIIKDKTEEQLKAHFSDEKKIFGELDKKLKEQIEIVKGMINSLKEIIRKEKEIAKEEEKAKEEAKKGEEGRLEIIEDKTKPIRDISEMPPGEVIPFHSVIDQNVYQNLLKHWRLGLTVEKLREIRNNNEKNEGKEAAALLKDIEEGRVTK